MWRIGLTGSIASGKTTVSAMFAQKGCPVFNADRAVHSLYERPDVLESLAQLCPGALDENGLNRVHLKKAVSQDQQLLTKLEALLHPLVHEEETIFLNKHSKYGAHAIVFDIPLLLEKNKAHLYDVIVVTACKLSTQRQRLQARQTMEPDLIDTLLARQMTMDKKLSYAHFVLKTDLPLDHTRYGVHTFLKSLP
jgi:dephospho-CoA kinase